MSIFESIKGERKLSFDNWRFRILHWAFRIKNPNFKNPEVNPLPLYLYTHYCPLFHLTNLIAFLSPIILLIRFFILSFFALMSSIAFIAELIPFDKLWPSFKSDSTPKAPKAPKPLTLEEERNSLIKIICTNYNTEFPALWTFVNGSFKLITEEDAKKIYDEYRPKVLAAIEAAKLRKDRWRQRIVFWINFSRVFIKCLINLFYFGLAGLVLYVLYEFSTVIWQLLCVVGGFIYWLFTDSVSFATLIFVIKFLGFIGITWGFLIVALRFKIFNRFLDYFLGGVEYIKPPFYIAAIPFFWIGKKCSDAYEFVQMFYEENCPPIKLITPEEEIIESNVDEGGDL